MTILAYLLGRGRGRGSNFETIDRGVNARVPLTALERKMFDRTSLIDLTAEYPA